MFDRFARAHQPASPRRHLLLILSLVCHAVAVIGLVIYSFIYVQELPEPILTLTLRIPPVPVMLGLGPRTESRPRPRPRIAQRTPSNEVRPHLQPPAQPPTPQPRAENPPANPASPPEPSDPGGDPDGDPNGDPGGDPNGGPGGGDPNGDPHSTGPGGQAHEAPPRSVRNVAHDLDPSQILHHPEPHLPDPVKARYRTSGEALFIAKVCIDRSGRVFRTDVIQGIEGADQAILATIHEWRYRSQPLPVCFAARWIFTIAP